MPIKVGMISLGCPKNQVDAEVMLAKLEKEGFRLVPHAGTADVVVINTCGFIEDAKKESIENILEMAALKKEGRIRGIVVTGCLSERYFHEMQKEFPEVDCVLTVGRAGDIAQACRAAYGGKKLSLSGNPEQFALGGARVLTTLPFYAYLKIAEGCDNCCTYCVIPKLRGRFRSRPMDELTEEARLLAAKGVKELVLVAQDTTRYGQDLTGRLMLPELLRRLARIDGIEWIRVLYGYPERITDELLDAIADEPKVVKYLDIPVQHASARVLKSMNRRGSGEELLGLLDKIRKRVPGIVLRSTVITGFPGETEEEFSQLAEFLKKARFERLGAFAYSREEGTPAAQMPGQIDEEVKRHRQDIIMEQQSLVSEQYNAAQIGKTLKVLAEGFDRYADCWFGRSEADAPDIDGKLFFTSARKISAGSFVNVKIKESMEYDLSGETVPEE